jgi:hypothetical protein
MLYTATLGAKIGLKLAAGMERQILSFTPVSLVWVPPIPRHSQYPCPKFDIAALLNDICNAYILKQRSIGASSDLYPCQWVQIRTRPHTAPQNAEFPANVNGLDTSSILHSDEVKGALSWVDSLLAQFGYTSHGDDRTWIITILQLSLSMQCI